jgi:biofilm PGA synthesis protein PgaD
MRFRDGALTLALWCAYLYLTYDFYAFIGEATLWLLNAGPVPEKLDAVIAVAGTLASYAGVAAANAVLLIAWARYNQFRFRGKERRKAVPMITVDDFARMYDFPSAEIARWQAARILVVHHDPDGRLIAVETRPQPDAVG